ncbi:hypothetical protein L1887_07720 [Cichorium endivia]|nr:hypothetical protein L1887_07720 [Cichorium endivia]
MVRRSGMPRKESRFYSSSNLDGHLHIDLNDVGRQQAVAVAERLSRESKISAIYYSDLKRALKTTETIANKCGGLQVIEDPNLRERHLGDLQSLVYGEAPKIKTKGGGESRINSINVAQIHYKRLPVNTAESEWWW